MYTTDYIKLFMPDAYFLLDLSKSEISIGRRSEIILAEQTDHLMKKQIS